MGYFLLLFCGLEQQVRPPRREEERSQCTFSLLQPEAEEEGDAGEASALAAASTAVDPCAFS